MATRMHIACVVAVIAISLPPPLAQGAEDEVVLLRIDGDLIGLAPTASEELIDREQALRLLDDYYSLLVPEELLNVEALHREILGLIPDFEVAYAAADSAEITHVMSEIDLRLAALQQVYATNYTQEVTVLLLEAYRLILPGLGEE